jgi:hypothetical protein
MLVMFRTALILFLGATGVAGTSNDVMHEESSKEHVVVLEAFDNPAHVWEEHNDPVMGGRSTGTFIIEDGVGKFAGEVVDVPFLQAPGFLQARTAAGSKFADISHCSALQIVAKSNTPYNGYRVSFGTAHAPGGKLFANGYKASFSIGRHDDDGVEKKGGFHVVTIPFEDFTDFWDDATGDPIKTCQDNPLYCPDEKTLKDIERLTLWAEGVAGSVLLEVKMFQAVGCSTSERVGEVGIA